MSSQDRFKERYKTGDTPWDVGMPEFNLTNMVLKRPIEACKALEIGCGTGDNAVWLSQHNFEVTGSDLSEIAIEKAKGKASVAGVEVTFLVADFLSQKIPSVPWGFIFDRGCFHSFDLDEDRSKFAQKVSLCLEKEGLWLSIMGNADGAPRQAGPPKRTAHDIVAAVEPCFKILSLTSSHFDSSRTNPPMAWVCLMQNRGGI